MKRFLKSIAEAIGLWMALPFLFWYWAEAALRGRRAALESCSQALSLIPGVPGLYIRRAFYRRTLARCSPTCVISFGVLFSDPLAQIGENVYIGPNCDIGRAIIEDDVLLGSGVHILSGKRQHFIEDLSKPIRLQGGQFHRVRIGRGSWVGNGAIIMADVGQDAVVGAKSVVTKAVEARSIVAGNPAKLICRREEAGHGAG
jgi:acetyltransferase-like isoleucine patch superfamily enzyme